MTLLGPAPCVVCRGHVWVVKRKVAFRCPSHSRLCTSTSLKPTVVDADGTTHMCKGLAS